MSHAPQDTLKDPFKGCRVLRGVSKKDTEAILKDGIGPSNVRTYHGGSNSADTEADDEKARQLQFLRFMAQMLGTKMTLLIGQQ